MKQAVPGRVYLVGAGPGAADLITVRGLSILRTADVVLYDALLDSELLEQIGPEAERLYVGKRGYCVGSTRQETIHELLITRAGTGKSVCRLKCGDPSVFGRGGEEAQALAEAGIPFEIVPGVTSALGACAAAKIPLTHRAVGPAVAFVSGHHDPDSPDCPIDWPTLAKLPTVVFYMAVRHIPKIAARLSEAGADAELPIAIIENASRQEQRIVVGTLSSPPTEAITGPALIVVGRVVDYRASQFEQMGQSSPLIQGAC